jgi:hypothetical protein
MALMSTSEVFQAEAFQKVLRELEDARTRIGGLEEQTNSLAGVGTEHYNLAHIVRVIQAELANDILRLDKRISAMEAQIAPMLELLKEALRLARPNFVEPTKG